MQSRGYKIWILFPNRWLTSSVEWSMKNNSRFSFYFLWLYKARKFDGNWLRRIKFICIFFFQTIGTFYLFIYLFILYCSGFCHTLTWISHGFTCIPHPYPPPTSFSPSGSSQCARTEHLSHASNLGWWTISP